MHAEILDWYRANKRDLPWRNTTAYGVMVSEFMLQQTPVARVLPVYEQWMRTWPDVNSLANASRADVLRMWGRLGYPRRALRLHEAAQQIASHNNGEVPTTLEELRALPGVGEYTAAAILSFAHGGRALVMDTNIRRLFARVIAGEEFPATSITKSERALGESLIPDEAALWAAATMELGAVICTAKSPNCERCPIAGKCAWRLAGKPKSEIQRRGQKWHGTDRQCRGTLMQVLKESTEPVKQSILEAAWEDRLQMQRCLDQLIREGLIEPLPHRKFALPR